MKNFVERLKNLSTLVIIAFVWMIIAFAVVFFSVNYGIFFAIISMIFVMLSLRE